MSDNDNVVRLVDDSQVSRTTFDITAGIKFRRRVRAMLDVSESDWTEYKGLLDSVFVVRARPNQVAYIQQWMEQHGAKFIRSALL